MYTTFTEERLAAATAIPANQRSPEVAAFIECCQLQQELAAEQQQWQGRCPSRQRQALADLKLTRSHFLNPAVPLSYRLAVLEAAFDRLHSEAQIEMVLGNEGAVGPQTMKLVDANFSLQTLLLAAAGIPLYRSNSPHVITLRYNAAAACLQQHSGEDAAPSGDSTAAARVRSAAGRLLPHGLITYNQLLALFIFLASEESCNLIKLGLTEGHSSVALMAADIDKADRAAAKQLPQLTPQHLRFRHSSAMAAARHSSRTETKSVVTTLQPIRQLKGLFEQARQQGSDFFVAACGYRLAALSRHYGIWGNICQFLAGQRKQRPKDEMEALAAKDVVILPSAFLGWLQQAREAHACCQAVLPMQWTVELKGSQKQALICKPWLQRQQQQYGDCWGDPHLDSRTEERLDALCKDPEMDTGVCLRCSGCGKFQAQLQFCGGCKQARYCSRDCQRSHWRQHRDYCKMQQAAQGCEA